MISTLEKVWVYTGTTFMQILFFIEIKQLQNVLIKALCDQHVNIIQPVSLI